MHVKQEVFDPIENNCYLITDENTNESALIDCSEFNEKMRALIGDTELKYILLTHGHFDHIGGVKAVKEQYGCQVAISAEDAPMLSDSLRSLALFSGGRQEKVQADILLKDGDTLSLGNITVKVLSTPGHTKGGLCFIAEDCLFTGDTLFRESCGRTDFPGGSSKELLRSLHRLRDLDGDYRVFAGHEGNSTLSHERAYNPYMNM